MTLPLPIKVNQRANRLATYPSFSPFIKHILLIFKHISWNQNHCSDIGLYRNLVEAKKHHTILKLSCSIIKQQRINNNQDNKTRITQKRRHNSYTPFISTQPRRQPRRLTSLSFQSKTPKLSLKKKLLSTKPQHTLAMNQHSPAILKQKVFTNSNQNRSRASFYMLAYFIIFTACVYT